MIASIFSGCSFQAPQNYNQFKASTAFSSYTKNFLSAKDALAKNDLKRSIEHAKQGADYKALANIYLGECALNISVGIKSQCEKYIEISDLSHSASSKAYFDLITNNIKSNEINHLPGIYQEFAQHLCHKEFSSAYQEVLKMDNITSLLISASLIRNSLQTNQIEVIISKASFYGYKKSTLFWLEELKNLTNDTKQKEKISKKISLLISKN